MRSFVIRLFILLGLSFPALAVVMNTYDGGYVASAVGTLSGGDSDSFSFGFTVANGVVSVPGGPGTTPTTGTVSSSGAISLTGWGCASGNNGVAVPYGTMTGQITIPQSGVATVTGTWSAPVMGTCDSRSGTWTADRGTGTHNASGTYIWNSATSTLTQTWTASDFVGCDGPKLGTKAKSGVVISGTSMIWPNNGFNWTLSGASSNSANSIVGTWTGTDPTTGNRYAVSFDAAGNVSVTANMVALSNCNDGGSNSFSNIQLEMRTDQGPNGTMGPRQHINIDVPEILGTVSSVAVSGPGISNSLALNPGPTRIVSGVSYDTFFGGFDPATPITSGSVYTFTVTNTAASGAGTSSSTQTYTGTPVTNTATGAITITHPTGFTLQDAALGGPLTVQWTLPTAYTISQLVFNGYVQTSPPGSNTGYQCLINGPTLPANATSGSITLPTTCGPNNDPVVQAGIDVATDGTNGERSIVIYQFTGSAATLSIPTATISVDGLVADWGSTAPLTTLPPGQGSRTVTGDNIKALYAATDGSNLYLRLDLYDAFNTGFWNYPAPNNGRYEFTIYNNGLYPTLDLGVAYGPGGQWTVGANGSNGAAPPELTGASLVAVAGSTMELKIPLSLIGSPSAVTGMKAQANDCCFINASTVQLPTVLGFIGTSGTSWGTGHLLPRLSGYALYDPDKDVTWVTNANLAATNNFGIASGIAADGSMSLSTAQSWIAAMNAANYLGFRDWRLPATLAPDATCTNQGGQVFYGCTGSELGHLFLSDLGGTAGTGLSSAHSANYGLFGNIMAGDYWSGTASVTSTGFTWAFLLDANASTLAGYQTVIPSASTAAHVLAVRSGDVYAGATGAAATNLSFVSGWNLVGNGINAPLTVASAFPVAPSTTHVSTVWKWIAASSQWAFYSPSLADGGLAYAASKGYIFLNSVNAGEGFWLNAKAAFTAPLPTGAAIASSAFADQLAGGNKLPSGWSLIAIGDNKSPRDFASAISATTPVSGTVPTTLTSLWAWNNSSSSWYFYAPSLDNAGTLATYISTKGYLNFFATPVKTLDAATGFWVNHP